MTTHVYMGYDPRDDSAIRVAIESLFSTYEGADPVEVTLLYEWELRHLGLYRRPYLTLANGQLLDIHDGRQFSTQFSYTRFIVPYLHAVYLRREGPAIFIDPDVMFRRSLHEIFDDCESDKYLNVVQHEHEPLEEYKMLGLVQQQYYRKNWSSLMVFNFDGPFGTPVLTPEQVSLKPRDELHSLEWAEEHVPIGSIDTTWNWLEGFSPNDPDPSIVHYTRGTPNFPDMRQAAYAEEWFQYDDNISTGEGRYFYYGNGLL